MKLGRSPSFSRGIELSSDPEIHKLHVLCCCKMVFLIVFAIKIFHVHLVSCTYKNLLCTNNPEWLCDKTIGNISCRMNCGNKNFLFQLEFLIVNLLRQQILCGRIIYINFVFAYLSIFDMDG